MSHWRSPSTQKIPEKKDERRSRIFLRSTKKRNKIRKIPCPFSLNFVVSAAQLMICCVMSRGATFFDVRRRGLEMRTQFLIKPTRSPLPDSDLLFHRLFILIICRSIFDIIDSFYLNRCTTLIRHRKARF